MEMALISLPLPPISLSLRRPIAIRIREPPPPFSVGMKMEMQIHRTKTKTQRRRTHLLCTFNSNSNSHSHSLTSASSDESEKKPSPIWNWSSFWTHLNPILKRLQAAAFAFFQRHQRLWQWQWQWPSRLRLAASLLTCAFLLLLLLCTCTRTRTRTRTRTPLFRSSPPLVPYSDLVSGIQLGRVSSVHFEEASRRIYFHATAPSNSHSQRFLTRKMDRDEKFLLALLRQHGVIYRSVPPPVSRLLLSCIGTIAGLWIGVVPLIWILERRLHGNSSTNKNPSATTPTVSFHDVQGVDSAKQELIELVNCLRGTLDYKKLGAKLPTGILLIGPPGTGKTLLARALAAEAGVPFFSISASEFVELYVGRGAARVRDLFKEARRQAPAVVFIDELDAVGTERDGFSAERDQTLNQLLTEMDGFDSDKQVIVLAATNRPAALDSALLRPGRFSRKVLVGEPDLEGRKRILAVHLKRIPLEEEMEVVCDLVASLTEGFVGADLANIANEAALLAVRRGGGLVTREDIMEAVEREKFGITENKANGVRGSKGLVKLLPWLPSLTQGSLKNKNRDKNAIGSRRVLSF